LIAITYLFVTLMPNYTVAVVALWQVLSVEL